MEPTGVARILVTGAAGFIGQALCPAFAARGHAIRAGLRRVVPAGDGIEPCLVGEIGPATDWSRALSGVEIVVHLAQRAHAGPDARALDAEPAALGALVRAASAAGVRRLVLLSSIKAMAEATVSGQALRAGDEPRPNDAYGRAKLASERAAADAAHERGVELVVIRPPLVYGPGAKANFAALLRLVHSGMPLPFAGIDNRRSLVARDNLVDLIAVAALHPAAAGRVLLCRDDEDLSTAALVRLLAGGMGRPSPMFALPAPLFAVLRAVPGIGPKLARLTLSLQVDDAATRATLGWAPPVPAATALAAAARAFVESL